MTPQRWKRQEHQARVQWHGGGKREVEATKRLVSMLARMAPARREMARGLVARAGYSAGNRAGRDGASRESSNGKA